MTKKQWVSAMKQFFGGAQDMIDHSLQVLAYAEQIMDGEEVPQSVRTVVTVSAVFHDIGIPAAIHKHGSAAGPYQEKEGERIVRELLTQMGEPGELVDRTGYIVGHHHTKDKIDGLDFQIIWEADMLVNLKGQDVASDPQRLEKVILANFKTHTGLQVAKRVYLS